MTWLFTAALLLASVVSSLAQSYLQLNSSGPKTVAISARVDENRDVFIIMTASDPAGVSRIDLAGNGKALISCATTFSCFYLWRRTAMRSGDNNLVTVVTNVAGQQFVVRTNIVKP